MVPFYPLVRNAHLATLAANFWPRKLDEARYPVTARLFGTEPGVKILIHEQRPEGVPLGEVVMVHGLEGSSTAGYMRSLAQTMLDAGFATHRSNIRSCGGTEFQCSTFYHAGLTSDLFAYLMDLDRQRRGPAWLVGFSLGANMVLKLAGELGADAARILAGIVAVSAPLDLAECSKALDRRENFIYQYRFLSAMKRRIQMRAKIVNLPVPLDRALKIRSVYELDDVITGPSFGFGGAANYYETQSARNFLAAIRVPTLLIQAKDDPMIPFEVFASHPALKASRFLRLAATDYGGHIGFVAHPKPRFWSDVAIRDWIVEQNRALNPDAEEKRRVSLEALSIEE